MTNTGSHKWENPWSMQLCATVSAVSDGDIRYWMRTKKLYLLVSVAIWVQGHRRSNATHQQKSLAAGMGSGLLAEPSIPSIFWFLMRSMIQSASSYCNEFTSTLNRASLLMWQSTWRSDFLDCSIPSVVALDWELVIKFVLFRPRNCAKSYKALGGPQHAYDTYPRLHLSMSSPRGAHICVSRKGILSRDMQRDPLSLCSPSIPAVIRSISGYPTFEALLFSSIRKNLLW